MAETQDELSGNSPDQTAVAPLMVAWLVSRLGVTLAPRSLRLANGARMDIDAASDDPPILCQAPDHTGLVPDVFKLVAARRLLGDHYRLILLVNHNSAAHHTLTGYSWHAAAIDAEGIEIMITDVEPEVDDRTHAT